MTPKGREAERAPREGNLYYRYVARRFRLPRWRAVLEAAILYGVTMGLVFGIGKSSVALGVILGAAAGTLFGVLLAVANPKRRWPRWMGNPPADLDV